MSNYGSKFPIKMVISFFLVEMGSSEMPVCLASSVSIKLSAAPELTSICRGIELPEH